MAVVLLGGDIGAYDHFDDVMSRVKSMPFP